LIGGVLGFQRIVERLYINMQPKTDGAKFFFGDKTNSRWRLSFSRAASGGAFSWLCPLFQ
jgi:hypothetical protein